MAVVPRHREGMDDVAVDERAELRVELPARVREADQIRREAAAPGVELVRRRHVFALDPPLDPGPRSLHEVRAEHADHAANERGPAGRRIAPPPARRADLAGDGELLDLLLLGQRQAVLQVVCLLRDLVGPVDDLGLEASSGLEAQALGEVEGERKVARPRRVLEDALAHVVRQVEPRLVVALLEPVHDPHRLVVVLEAPGFGMALAQQAVEDVLPRVAEGRVPEVVADRHRLRQVLVQAQRPGHAPGDLRDLERVREPCPEVVALVGNEHLGLVLEAAERPGMDDPVPVAGVVRAGIAGRGRHGPARALGPGALRGEHGEALLLEPLEVLARERSGGGGHSFFAKRPERSVRASPTR